jgi:acetyl-CoA carboxylase biotin carboxylase subunit
VIKKILIANRGEIACRIIKTAKKLGINTVAVYSDADRTALHTRMANESYYLGPSPSSQSYLLSDKILEIAKISGADAIHPGYGFLSENADFADAVISAGLIFIGPTGDSMRKMGSKIEAKQTAKAAGVPLVPGTDERINDMKLAAKTADEIGYPLLIKASAGGGGKGMRIVNTPESFEQEVHRAMSEAKSSFGDASVFIEKYVESPKHIEVQVLADMHGNAVYLFERECSIQRRHQKLIEEAPSAVIDPLIRKQIGEAAVRLTKTCNYHGAGTIEFLLDKNKNFYFLEMNTRLQVEHPVTELITDLDLVECQIQIANGQPLDFTQDDLKINGHAMELRICAEDPSNNFLPATGVLEIYQEPNIDGVRVDSGFHQGDQISVYYDSMIAKLVVHAPNRDAAIQKLQTAIHAFQIVGIPTTFELGLFALQHPAFIDGSFDTGFIDKYFSAEALKEIDSDIQKAAAIAALYFYKIREKSIALPN